MNNLMNNCSICFDTTDLECQICGEPTCESCLKKAKLSPNSNGISKFNPDFFAIESKEGSLLACKKCLNQ